MNTGDSTRYAYLDKYSEDYPKREYLYDAYDEQDLADGNLLALPEVLPVQECLRCGNRFPGGLERCTACGLHVKLNQHQPDASLPWHGYNRGVIVCQTCGFTNSDYLARKNRIQKCDQCGKTVYIPSGLYNRHTARPVRYKHKRRLPNPLFELFDIIGSVWTNFMRSPAKWPILLGSILVALIGLVGVIVYKQEANKPKPVTPPVIVYYNQVLSYESRLTNALDTFNQDSGGGGLVQKGDYDKWSLKSLDQANSGRFIRNAKILLDTIEGIIPSVNGMTAVPDEAQDFHQKFLKTLTDNQVFYARLKDGVQGARPDLWNSAFDIQDQLKADFKAQVQAFEVLQQLELSLTHAS